MSLETWREDPVLKGIINFDGRRRVRTSDCPRTTFFLGLPALSLHRIGNLESLMGIGEKERNPKRREREEKGENYDDGKKNGVAKRI